MAGKKAKAKARKAVHTTSTPAPPDYIEIKPADSKGDGIFATQFIPVGTMIIREKPIMTIHKLKDMIAPWDVEAAYRKLCATDKHTFDNMRKCVCDMPFCIGRFATFVGNMFNVAEDWSIVGAYPTASRFNHGSNANWIVQSNDCEGPLEISHAHDIVAIRNIAAGEELTFWYSDDVQYMTTNERRAYFKKEQQCYLLRTPCSLPAKDRLASDLRRCLIRHLHYWIRQRGQDLKKASRTIHSPIRKLNSFQVAMYTLLWGYLAEAEGLTFETCRWRWWGFISSIMHVLICASDKKLDKVPLQTVENMHAWWEIAQKATADGEDLSMNQDILMHSGAAEFLMCIECDGKIRWNELGKYGKRIVNSYGGTSLDY